MQEQGISTNIQTNRLEELTSDSQDSARVHKNKKKSRLKERNKTIPEVFKIYDILDPGRKQAANIQKIKKKKHNASMWTSSQIQQVGN